MRVWFRLYWYSYLYYLGFPLLVLSLCLLSSEFTSSRIGNLIIGILLGIVGLVGFQVVYGILALKPKAQGIVRRFEGQMVRVYCNDEGIGAEGDGRAESYEWRHVHTLWKLPTVWLLFHTESEFISFPLERMSDEHKQFMLDKVTEFGGRVTT